MSNVELTIFCIILGAAQICVLFYIMALHGRVERLESNSSKTAELVKAASEIHQRRSAEWAQKFRIGK
jgi:Tfp pilus assembly protein PilO